MAHQSIDKTNAGRMKVFIAFAIVYVVWGTTYLAIRLAIETIPPFLMAGIRFTISGIMIYGWCYLRCSRKPSLSDWRKAAFAGILMMCFGNGLVTWSEQFIPSGYASLIVATVPIWMVILDWASSARNKPNKLTIAGIGVGLFGVALLSGMDEGILIDSARHGHTVVQGILVLTLASMSWAVGSIYSRGTKTNISLQFRIGMQTLAGGTALILIGLTQGEASRLSYENLSFVSVSALIYLIVFGTLIAYSAYVWLLNVSTPAKVGTYAFFNPLVAVLLGALILDEPVTTLMLVGACCILMSLFLVNQPKFRKKKVGAPSRLSFHQIRKE